MPTTPVVTPRGRMSQRLLLLLLLLFEKYANVENNAVLMPLMR